LGITCGNSVLCHTSRKIDLMGENELTPFQSSQLQYLRTEVDRAQDDSLRSDPHPNANNKLFYARQELKEFTKNLRCTGKNI
jgi:hypothetical protein